VKKPEILRSRELFKHVAMKGKRLNSRLLHCKYVIHKEAESPLQVAFKVPARHFNAVRRNRLKRLMREGFSKERAVLDVALANRNARVAMFFTFNDSDGIFVERLKLQDVQPDVRELCRAIASKLNEAR
jgi:ribonuclease P protein component